MKYYNTLEEYRAKSGRPGGRLVGEENGAVRGCCVGLSHGMSRVHKEVGDIHEDQEGFFVWKGHGEALIGGLKKLARENFSNLAPSPALVVLEYSHPPLAQRIEAIEGKA